MCVCYLVINIIGKDSLVISFIIILVIHFSNNTGSLVETFMTISINVDETGPQR